MLPAGSYRVQITYAAFGAAQDREERHFIKAEDATVEFPVASGNITLRPALAGVEKVEGRVHGGAGFRTTGASVWVAIQFGAYRIAGQTDQDGHFALPVPTRGGSDTLGFDVRDESGAEFLLTLSIEDQRFARAGDAGKQFDVDLSRFAFLTVRTEDIRPDVRDDVRIDSMTLKLNTVPRTASSPMLAPGFRTTQVSLLPDGGGWKSARTALPIDDQMMKPMFEISASVVMEHGINDVTLTAPLATEVEFGAGSQTEFVITPGLLKQLLSDCIINGPPGAAEKLQSALAASLRETDQTP